MQEVLRRRGVWFGGAAILIVAAVVGVIVWRSGGQTRSPSSASTSNQLQVTAGGRELISLLEAGRRVSFHATYRAIGNSSVLGGALTMEVWQAPPHLREDTTHTEGAQKVHTASFLDTQAVHVCSQTDQQPWVCHQSRVDASRGPSGLLATLGYDLSGRLVTISDDTIAGRRVRCFTVGAASGPVQLCATATGIPVRIAGGSVSFELTKLDSSVPTAIFRVPAPDSK